MNKEKVFKTCGVNLYSSLSKYIIEQITNGNYPPGSSLPTEKWFSDTFEISRVTVRKAINDLINDGQLIREKGKSPTIPIRKYTRDFNKLSGFSEQIIAEGHIPSAEIIKFKNIKANIFIANKLKIKEGSTVTYVKRLRYSDGIPIAIQNIYLNSQFSQGLTLNDLSYSSLYSFFESKGIVLDYSEQIVHASMPSDEIKKLLKLDSKTAVFDLERITFLKSGDIIEYVKVICDAHKYNIKVNLYR